MHRALGGQGRSRHNEESNKPYNIEVTTMPEHKESGIPKKLLDGLEGEWLADAMSQAERGAPIGSHVLPAVGIMHRWLIVDLRPTERHTVLPHSTSRRPLP